MAAYPASATIFQKLVPCRLPTGSGSSFGTHVTIAYVTTPPTATPASRPVTRRIGVDLARNRRMRNTSRNAATPNPAPMA
ncbi:MAG: hypothetical protein M5R36_16815 [Deltaproteobacteria bacterium]|nr:hypothetical protein [Deltaproteobacteria bacterium]